MIWATGFRSDYSSVDAPVFEDTGQPRHRRGVTDAEGLYFLGLYWQHTRGCALIGFIDDEAEFIADRISERTSVPERAGL